MQASYIFDDRRVKLIFLKNDILNIWIWNLKSTINVHNV